MVCSERFDKLVIPVLFINVHYACNAVFKYICSVKNFHIAKDYEKQSQTNFYTKYLKYKLSKTYNVSGIIMHVPICIL